MSVSPPVIPATGTSRHTLLLTFRSSAVAAVVTYSVNLAIVPFVLRRVGADLYGAWATMASILAVGALADAGVRTEIIRRVAAAKGGADDAELVRSVRQGVTLLVLLAGVIVLVGAVCAPGIRAFAFPDGVPGYGQPEIDLLIRLTICVLAASLVANGYFGVLRGVQRGDVETTGTMLAVGASALVTVVGVAMGWRLWALFAGSVAALFVSIVWNRTGVRRVVPDLRFGLAALTRPLVKAYLALSSLALLSQVSEVVDSQWDKVILSHYVGSKAVASFQIGTTLVLQGKALALLPLAPLVVAIAELRGRDRARMNILFDLMARAGMAIAAVMLGAIFVFAPAFLRLWLGAGETSTQAAVAARLFTVAVGLNLLGAPLALRAFGEGWYRLTSASSLLNMVLNGGVSLALTIALGFNGALYGSIAGSFAGCALLLFLMRRRMGEEWTPIPWRGPLTGGAFAAVALIAGLGHATHWPALLVSGVAYVVLAGLACLRAERLRFGDLLSRAQRT